jgi:hypothetical protein
MYRLSWVVNVLLIIVSFMIGALLGATLTGHQIYMVAMLMFVSSLFTSGVVLISEEKWQWHTWSASAGSIAGMYAAYYLFASLKS